MSRPRWWRRVLAYIDDWYSTTAESRAFLEQPCSNPSCPHQRYQHGITRVQRIEGTSWSREVTNAPGVCTMCRCDVFHEPNAITREDVIDFHEQLASVHTFGDLVALGGVA